MALHQTIFARHAETNLAQPNRHTCDGTTCKLNGLTPGGLSVQGRKILRTA
jgi:hypothetical protein